MAYGGSLVYSIPNVETLYLNIGIRYNVLRRRPHGPGQELDPNWWIPPQNSWNQPQPQARKCTGSLRTGPLAVPWPFSKQKPFFF